MTSNTDAPKSDGAAAAGPFQITPNETPTSAAKISEILANPGFGQYFTEHMVLIDWDKDRGWHSPRVEPYRNVSDRKSVV